VLTDRADHTKEPNIAMSVHGARMRPGFFPYAMTDVAAKFQATEGRVVFGECSARHGLGDLKMMGGEVRTGSGLWVDVRDLAAGPLNVDEDLTAALPLSMQRGRQCAAADGPI